MPFMGQDWRAPGDAWVKTIEGWERIKLRPIQVCTSDALLSSSPETSPTAIDPISAVIAKGRASVVEQVVRNRQSSCLSMMSVGSFSDEENSAVMVINNDCSIDDRQQPQTAVEFDLDFDEDEWQPHCFVKTGKSKEFVGCTSISEAFHRLNLARAVTDVRRFNYICKVVQILVREKLRNLSGSARKIVLATVEAVVVHTLESDGQLKVARDLVSDFMSGLDTGHHCGSPKLLNLHQGTINNLYMLLTEQQPSTPAECGEDAVTFLDLPRECLSAILKRLPDHVSLLEAAKAHEALESLVENERRIWHGLCQFHYSPAQVSSRVGTNHDVSSVNWRHTFFELKKAFGLREVYANLIHICCHCKALFWKEHGHPCVSADAPSVRVTPQQFVDMLLFL